MKMLFNRAFRLLFERECSKSVKKTLLRFKESNCFSTKVNSLKCQDLNSMSKINTESFMSSFDTVLTDCDGVLWHGGQEIEGSSDAISIFRELGKRVIFVTNNGVSRNDLLVRCQQMGFGGCLDDMVTASFVCAQYLKEKKLNKTVYVFGGKGLVDELTNAGIKSVGFEPDPMPERWDLETAEALVNSMEQNVGCVVVGFQYDISYIKLLKAVTYLHNPEVLFLGTNSDPVAVLHFQNNKTCIMPASGSFISAVRTASGREPVILGKPNQIMFEAVKRVCPNIQPDRTLMIGDRADTDVLFGKNSDLITLMVGTGTNSRDDIFEWCDSNDSAIQNLVPDYYSKSLIDVFMNYIRDR